MANVFAWSIVALIVAVVLYVEGGKLRRRFDHWRLMRQVDRTLRMVERLEIPELTCKCEEARKTIAGKQEDGNGK